MKSRDKIILNGRRPPLPGVLTVRNSRILVYIDHSVPGMTANKRFQVPMGVRIIILWWIPPSLPEAPAHECERRPLKKKITPCHIGVPMRSKDTSYVVSILVKPAFLSTGSVQRETVRDIS